MAPPIPIPGFTPQPPPISILTSAEPLRGAGQSLDNGEPAWTQGGVVFEETACSYVRSWPSCEEDTDLTRTKEPPAAPPVTTFRPFMIYVFEPDCRDFLLVQDEKTALNRARIEAGQAWQVARQLWTGVENPSNPSLQRSAEVLNPDAVSPLVALEFLIAAFHNDCMNGELMIHVPTVMLPELIHLNVVQQQGNRYIGPMGAVIVPGPGYPAGEGADGSATAWGPYIDPDDPDAGFQGQADDEVWMYATGRVEYALGSIRQPLPNVSMPHIFNSFRLLGERFGIVRFETQSVWAQKAFIPDSLSSGVS